MSEKPEKTPLVEGVDYELNRQNLESLKIWSAYGLGFGGCIGWLVATFGTQIGLPAGLCSWGILLGLALGTAIGALAFCIVGVAKMRRDRRGR